MKTSEDITDRMSEQVEIDALMDGESIESIVTMDFRVLLELYGYWVKHPLIAIDFSDLTQGVHDLGKNNVLQSLERLAARGLVVLADGRRSRNNWLSFSHETDDDSSTVQITQHGILVIESCAKSNPFSFLYKMTD